MKGKYQGSGTPYSPGKTASTYHVEMRQRIPPMTNIKNIIDIDKVSSGAEGCFKLAHCNPTPAV